MIKVNLKRIEDNLCVTFGILSIPQFNFKCMTLELAEGKGKVFMHNCRIPEGVYQLVPGFAMNHSMFPVFRYKINGFPKKPSFNIVECKYTDLPTGDIALGVGKANEFAIQPSKDVNDTFCNIMREVFVERENVVLAVFKKKAFTHTEYSYKDYVSDFKNNCFVDDDDDEEYDTNEVFHEGSPMGEIKPFGLEG